MSEDEAATRAIFKVVVMTALLDGSPDLSEAKVVSEVVKLDPRFAGLGDAFELGVQARVALDQQGVEDALEQLCQEISSPGDQLLAFRLCARVMIADGRTEGDEAMLLGSLQEIFGIDHADVVEMLTEERKRKATG